MTVRYDRDWHDNDREVGAHEHRSSAGRNAKMIREARDNGGVLVRYPASVKYRDSI